MQGLNRAQAQITGFQQQEAAANQNQAAMIGAGIVGLGNIAGAIGGNKGTTGKTGKTKKTYEGNPWSASGSETITTTTPGDDDWIPGGYN
jgi:hypothetical protein